MEPPRGLRRFGLLRLRITGDDHELRAFVVSTFLALDRALQAPG